MIMFDVFHKGFRSKAHSYDPIGLFTSVTFGVPNKPFSVKFFSRRNDRTGSLT